MAEPPTGASRRPGAFGRRPPTGARAAAGPAQSSDDRRASCPLHADGALLCARATLRGRGAPAVAPAPASGRAHRRRHSSSPMALSRPSIRAAGTHHSSDPTGAPQRLSALDRPPEAYPSGPCQRCGLAGPPPLHPPSSCGATCAPHAAVPLTASRGASLTCAPPVGALPRNAFGWQ